MPGPPPPLPNDYYPSLRVAVADGIAWVTLDSPGQRTGAAAAGRLVPLRGRRASRRGVRVIVVQSANPDFFIAHVDMELINQGEAFARLAAELFPDPSPLETPSSGSTSSGAPCPSWPSRAPASSRPTWPSATAG